MKIVRASFQVEVIGMFTTDLEIVGKFFMLINMAEVKTRKNLNLGQW